MRRLGCSARCYSYPLFGLSRIDLVHEEEPLLAKFLLALCTWLSNDLPNLDLQSTDSAFVSSLVSKNGLGSPCGILSWIPLHRQLLSFSCSRTILDPFEGVLSTCIQSTLFHGIVESFRYGMNSSVIGTALSIQLLGLILNWFAFVHFLTMAAQCLSFGEAGATVTTLILFLLYFKSFWPIRHFMPLLKKNKVGSAKRAFSFRTYGRGSWQILEVSWCVWEWRFEHYLVIFSDHLVIY